MPLGLVVAITHKEGVETPDISDREVCGSCQAPLVSSIFIDLFQR